MNQINNNTNQVAFLKYPAYVCAPMVEQSELPFRMLTRKYGVTIAYTPMLHSKMMVTNKTYKQEHFTTCHQDRPVVAQICGHDPQIMVKAAKMLQNQVDAIDINMGCPQGIARKGHYGSFLLEQPQLIERIVKTLTENIKVPIFCKIRRVKSEQKTLELVQRIQKAGCKLLTVHGRTKQQNKDRVGSADWDIIRKIKQTVNIPVFANGGVYTFPDVNKCLAQTHVDGVMSAQALLQNPALFYGQIVDIDRLAFQYLQMTEIYPGANDSCIRGHLFKMLYVGLSSNIDIREKLVKAQGLNGFRQIVHELNMRRVDIKYQNKLGWYLRYWKQHPAIYYINGISTIQKEKEGNANEIKQIEQQGQKEQKKQMMADQQIQPEPLLIQEKQAQTVQHEQEHIVS